jgi:hypothetical protein
MDATRKKQNLCTGAWERKLGKRSNAAGDEETTEPETVLKRQKRAMTRITERLLQLVSCMNK